jgi:serine/threonine protein phosphatase PrpC
MNVSLNSHINGYRISFFDAFLALGTGCTGGVYVGRHWNLSQRENCQFVWGHRAIAVLEAIPVFGGLIALIERVTAFLCNYFYPDPKVPIGEVRTYLDENRCIDKMLKNGEKAIKEHQGQEGICTLSSEFLPSVKGGVEALELLYIAAEAKGKRESIEDAHFYVQLKEGVFTGVLDGHGGKEVADYASARFQEIFSEILRENSENVHRAFEISIQKVHQEVAEKPDWNKKGSTAVLSFIDKKNRIYTATLGDSEAFIYRKNSKGELKSIPLSCVRDFASQKDAKRVTKSGYLRGFGHKKPRFYYKDERINVSRSIGDCSFDGGVVHKAKIAMNQLKKGDILILACDGLRDFVTEEQIIKKISETPVVEQLAAKLVEHALETSTDNVSVVVVAV